MLVTPSSFGGEWWVPEKYVDRLGGADFRKLIFIDRTNQNLATLEQGGFYLVGQEYEPDNDRIA
ncbi:MAG: hypothetical protein ACLUHB_04360 [Odoribacter splanchnicus]